LKSAASAGRGRQALLAALVLATLSVAAAAPAVADTPDPEAGRRIYREGILPSGEPLTALVTGDVPFLGTQLSCQGCHGRSGMGAAEGRYIVPAIAGQLLHAPSPQPVRPAYDLESLARALREGVDPAGRPLDRLMPRFQISDDEVAALAAYLAGLSTGAAPGVDDETIRFATVVTDDVPEEAREAVVAVLRTYVDEKNRQTRLESQRWDRGSTPASRLPTIFREWVLDVWTLTGPSDQWSAQLEARYRSAPVFALLGGSSAGTWGPMGRFCEGHEIPCLFPGTDLPDAEEGDFYTLHFSRGLPLEAELIASHLADHPVRSVVQVFCGATPARAAAALRTSLTDQGIGVEDVEFACEDDLPMASLAARMGSDPSSAAVLWLRRAQLPGSASVFPPGRLYFSSTLLDRDLEAPALAAAGPVFVAHPYRLPGEPDSAFVRFTLWARTRGIEITHPRLQAEAFFACLAANDAISHLGRFFVRDYVLDMLDHAQGMAVYLPIHPRPTLGPGQRFLTKGGYVLRVVDGRPDADAATWIRP
jgi:cytochrome c553